MQGIDPNRNKQTRKTDIRWKMRSNDGKQHTSHSRKHCGNMQHTTYFNKYLDSLNHSYNGSMFYDKPKTTNINFSSQLKPKSKRHSCMVKPRSRSHKKVSNEDEKELSPEECTKYKEIEENLELQSETKCSMCIKLKKRERNSNNCLLNHQKDEEKKFDSSELIFYNGRSLTKNQTAKLILEKFNNLMCHHVESSDKNVINSRYPADVNMPSNTCVSYEKKQLEENYEITSSLLKTAKKRMYIRHCTIKKPEELKQQKEKMKDYMAPICPIQFKEIPKMVLQKACLRSQQKKKKVHTVETQTSPSHSSTNIMINLIYENEPNQDNYVRIRLSSEDYENYMKSMRQIKNENVANSNDCVMGNKIEESIKKFEAILKQQKKTLDASDMLALHRGFLLINERKKIASSLYSV